MAWTETAKISSELLLFVFDALLPCWFSFDKIFFTKLLARDL